MACGPTSRRAWRFLVADVLLGRIADPDEIAAPAYCLMSDEASYYVTTQILTVDGGQTTD